MLFKNHANKGRGLLNRLTLKQELSQEHKALQMFQITRTSDLISPSRIAYSALETFSLLTPSKTVLFRRSALRRDFSEANAYLRVNNVNPRGFTQQWDFCWNSLPLNLRKSNYIIQHSEGRERIPLCQQMAGFPSLKNP